MKKYILLGLLSAGALLVHGQRMVLYEEFTGENSALSAAANPGLDALVNANPTKVLLLKYMAPLPTPGTLFVQNPADVQNRISYYGVTFTPYGRMDGKVLGTGSTAGHVNNLTQTEIDNEAALPSPFSITASHSWSAAGDSIYATVTVQATSSFAPAGAQMMLRAALVESLSFTIPPGTNHESSFQNVVRKMLPDANGTPVPNSWTASQTQTFNLSGLLPSFLNKAGKVFLIVWLQNNTDKLVAQAASSQPLVIPLDAGSDRTSFPISLLCTNSATNAIGHVTLKNAGSDPLTSARIFYKLDNSAWSAYNWTGLMAPGGTVNVILPGLSALPGVHVLTDSVTLPNNATDINAGNSKSDARVWVHNIVAVNLPQTADFENSGNLPANWLLYDADGNTRNWKLVNAGSPIGHGNSSYALVHRNYDYPAGEVNYAILPQMNLVAGPKVVEFWQAHAQFALEEDMLELVYSLNCGLTWDPLWAQAGGNLATAPSTDTSFVPTQAQWKHNAVDVSGIPASSMLAFRATSQYGNNLYLDDISVHTGTASQVASLLPEGGLRLYPNPARDQARLSFLLSGNANVRVSVTDATGRLVAVAMDEYREQGMQQLTLSTSDLAPGLYLVQIRAGALQLTRRLAVVK